MLLLLFSIGTAFAQGIDGKYKESEEILIVDNVKRTFILHEPLPSISQRPLIFILHGNGGSGALMKSVTLFNDIADKNNAVVVYPDGYDQTWNDGRSTVRIKHIDDIKFFKTMTENLIKKYDINPSKIYVAGLSNGAMMALHLSCETDIFKGVAAVAASLPQDMVNRCINKPISRLMMVGNKAPIIPYDGGEIKSFGKRGQGGMVLGLNSSMDYFKKLNGITDTPIIHTEKGITKTLYTQYNIQLQGYVIDGGGHTWGSAISRLPESVVGELPPIYLNASQIVWSFFPHYLKV